MESNRRFTLLTFPQHFDGQLLKVNVVFLPRNQNPLMPATDAVPDVPEFAKAKLSFAAHVIPGLTGLPTAAAALPPIGLSTAVPASAHALFEALANQFTITNKGAVNSNASLDGIPTKERAPAPVSVQESVWKYLPQSYRRSFNFVAPRTPNAVTDDAYHCAVRDAKVVVGFVQSPEKISWGQVFAHAMRQPLLARSLGMIYEAEFTVEAAHFAQGGWLFIDLADDSDYKAQQLADDAFVRRYAARIPALAIGTSRNVFAAVQFPVLPVAPPGIYDEIFIEAAEYDEGFAKVVHASQPLSSNLLLEESDGQHPSKDAGIRLGWDDEQILIWYIRQLAEDAATKQRIDAPIGVSGYRIDVREKHTPPLHWNSLTLVSSAHPLAVVDPITSESITLGSFTAKELPYQVYPTQLDGDPKKPYWLPMYFAAWNGHSMVLPDTDAARIYQHGKVAATPSTNVNAPPANDLAKIYRPAPVASPLRYGKVYELRVRLGDLSGGGPTVDQHPTHELRPQIATCHFKRYVAPNALRIADLPVNTDDQLFAGDQLTLTRPLLGYPAVVFTGQYADPVTELANASLSFKGKEAFGIPDPDVAEVEITVEVQTLKMDNLLSVSGQESYIEYYKTTRTFPTASALFDDTLTLPFEFRDCNVLTFGDTADLGDLGVTEAELDAMHAIVLPTARLIRLTLRAVCAERSDYYGLEQDDPEFNTRYGRIVQFQLYRPSEDESGLFAETTDAETLRGIYLQPDPPFVFDGNLASLLLGKELEKAPNIMQRLAQQLGLEHDGLTLTGRKGERVQFGCSQRIRHTLSPDNSSLTFASKDDLIHHWLCTLTLTLDRDWTWNGLDDRSLVIERKKRFREDDIATETDVSEVGDIELKRTVPFVALKQPQRDHTRIVFIDAVETKNEHKRPAPHAGETRFPDLIALEYTVHARLKPGHGAGSDALTLPLLLPITTPPAQSARIVSAGIALSPYQRNEKYSETEPRRRVLWIEFAEPISDSKDAYFARVLAYAPDQLISHNHPELLVVPDEPALGIEPEPIRVVIADQSNDDAGLSEMQLMEQSTDRDRFYLLPLPEHLHAESPEMFGFFTYEICIGHNRYTDTTAHHHAGESVWTTAHGRYGRPLRVTGLQHPAPTLMCTADRDEDKLHVSAPYAVAVHKGRDVTADPPRTEVWCLLYAQVTQADKRDFRNVLLDDRRLDPRLRVEHEKDVNWASRYTKSEIATLKKATIQNFRDDTSYANHRQLYKLADTTGINKDSTKRGTAVWSNAEVSQLLAQYGLPADAALSVLCVELLPHITNVHEHVSRVDEASVRSAIRRTLGDEHALNEDHVRNGLMQRVVSARSVDVAGPRPLSDALGHYRILRTSPLVAVPFVCCS